MKQLPFKEMIEAMTLIPEGKLRCIVTGDLRRDTPEENVRQRIARSLMESYGYKAEDIAIEFSIEMASSKKRVDIAIFPERVNHKQENIKIIVECKREEIRPTDPNNGIGQLKSYLSACRNAKFGLWIGSELSVWEVVEQAGVIAYEPAVDIPRAGSNTPQPIKFADLKPAHEELIEVFKRCHNYIYGNQGFHADTAFQELLKIIFCKVYDETTHFNAMKFAINNEDRRSDIGQRKLHTGITDLFDKVKKKYPYIFEPNEIIHLNNNVLAYIVSELQHYSLLDTETDVKGAAYEEMVGNNMQGDRGEFFTPRNVCNMAVSMAFATYPENEWQDLQILDPACGTGGFLVAAMNELYQYIYAQQLEKYEVNKYPDNLERAIEATRRLLEDDVKGNLRGIDFNPVLVRAAQMNLVMHGDGSTNIFQTNSLLPFGEWRADVSAKVEPGQFDIVLTNPPFGSKIPIDDPHLLKEFELARFNDRGVTLTSMPPEQLFIERCLKMLKPGGRLAIVLPDSILSNPGLMFIRDWILLRARLIASVDLPQVTFEPNVGVQTSVLLLQKKTEEEIRFEAETGQRRDYEVFMTTPQQVGHDRRGHDLYLRTPDGKYVEQEIKRKVYHRTADGHLVSTYETARENIKHDELPEVVEYFKSWINQPGRMRWLNG